MPERIVLMAGGNNLSKSFKEPEKPEIVVEKMRELIRYIKDELPNVQLQTWAIPRDYFNSDTFKEYNRLLELMCKQERCSFSKELYEKTLEQDNRIFHNDKTHLSLTGYKICMLPFLPK